MGENLTRTLITISTILLVVFNCLLWRVSSDANKATVQIQRAFLTSSGPIILNNPLVEDKPLIGFTANMLWTNSGTTPTTTAIVQANIAIVSESSQFANFDTLPQSSKKTIVIGPKAIVPTDSTAISIKDLEAIAQGAKHGFFWGWAVYRDIFPDTPMRLSEFCIDFNDPKWTKKDHTDRNGNMVVDTPACPVHNCYDEHCRDYTAKVQEFDHSLRNP